jgi:hypothetical protein
MSGAAGFNGWASKRLTPWREPEAETSQFSPFQNSSNISYVYPISVQSLIK